MKPFFVFILCLLALNDVSAMCVNGPKAHLRRGPSLKHDIGLEAIPYTPLKKLSKKDGWYEVADVDQKKYWVREDLVTESFKCVVIKSEFANLRTGPGIKFPKAAAGMGEKYLSFKLVQDKKEWVKAEDFDGDQVWIQKKLVWID